MMLRLEYRGKVIWLVNPKSELVWRSLGARGAMNGEVVVLLGPGREGSEAEIGKMVGGEVVSSEERSWVRVRVGREGEVRLERH